MRRFGTELDLSLGDGASTGVRKGREHHGSHNAREQRGQRSQPHAAVQRVHGFSLAPHDVAASAEGNPVSPDVRSPVTPYPYG